MVKVDINGKEYYYDNYLHANLLQAKKYTANKWDNIFFVSGTEGSGKTYLANQMAYFLDPTYTLDRCVFSGEEFMRVASTMKEGEAIVFDEAQETFESTNRSRDAMAVKNFLTRVRHKRLNIIICAPDFWRISRYLFLHRCRLFFKVYNDGMKRGYFACWGSRKKRELWVKGKKEENIHAVRPSFRGRFTAWFPLNEPAYEKKKAKSYAYDEVKSNTQEERVKELTRIILFGSINDDDDRANHLKVSKRTIYRMKKDYANCQLSNNLYVLPSDGLETQKE